MSEHPTVIACLAENAALAAEAERCERLGSRLLFQWATCPLPDAMRAQLKQDAEDHIVQGIKLFAELERRCEAALRVGKSAEEH